VPSGYLLVAAAVATLLVAGAYMLGYDRGRLVERAILLEDPEAFLAPVSDTPAGMQVRDPLDQPRSSPPRANAPIGTSSTHGGGWGQIESDPRECGLEYFVLAETNRQGAVRLAEYCRERGLETYVVPGKNASLRRVIVMPGFDRSQRSGREAKALEERIHRIGDTWQREERGATNLRDAYPLLNRC
jgi:hypothetical protein